MRLATLCVAAVMAILPGGGADVRAETASVESGGLSGRLPNGLAYRILPQEGEAAASLRLVIEAGSAHEPRGQEGVAHLLEHLAFRGSAGFPEGGMVNAIQALGVQMGADANATTSVTHTVFQIDIADANPGKLAAGLRILREIAGRLELSADALESERAVVLAEEGLRDTPINRNNALFSEMLYGDSSAANLPIGSQAAIRSASLPQLKRFYNTYYRPDRASIIVVGSVDKSSVISDINQQFESWEVPHGHSRRPDIRLPNLAGKVRLHEDSAFPDQVIFVWRVDASPSAETHDDHLVDELDALALRALNNRLSALADSPDVPFLGALAGETSLPELSRVVSVRTIGAGDTTAALKSLSMALRDAAENGFTQEEFDQAVRDSRLRLERAEKSLTKPAEIADAVVRATMRREPYLSPGERRARLEKAAVTFGPQDLKRSLQRLAPISSAGLYVTRSKPAGEGVGQVASAFRDAKAARLDRVTITKAETAWPFASKWPGGEILSRRTEAEGSVTRVQYANHVKLVVKSIPARPGQVLTQIAFGRGALALPSDRVSPGVLWAGLLPASGIGSVTPQDKKRLLASRGITLGATTGEDRFLLTATGAASGIQSQMEVLLAQMTEPVWSKEVLDQQRGFLRAILGAPDATPEAAYARQAPALLRGGDARWLRMTPEALDQITIEQVRDFITPALRDGPLEITVVGDVNAEDVLAATARTFGSLPARRETEPPMEARAVSSPPYDSTLYIHHAGRGDLALAVVTWRLSLSPADRSGMMSARILQKALASALQETFREERSQTYAVQGEVAASEIYEFATLTLRAQLPPSEVTAFFDSADRQAELLGQQTLEEADWRDALSNADALRHAEESSLDYIATVLRAHRKDGESSVRGILEDMGPSPANVMTFARRELAATRRWRLAVLPQ